MLSAAAAPQAARGPAAMPANPTRSRPALVRLPPHASHLPGHACPPRTPPSRPAPSQALLAPAPPYIPVPVPCVRLIPFVRTLPRPHTLPTASRHATCPTCATLRLLRRCFSVPSFTASQPREEPASPLSHRARAHSCSGPPPFRSGTLGRCTLNGGRRTVRLITGCTLLLPRRNISFVSIDRRSHLYPRLWQSHSRHQLREGSR